MLFEDSRMAGADFAEEFFNPKNFQGGGDGRGSPQSTIMSLSAVDEVRKYFASGNKRHPETGMVARDLILAELCLGEYLTSKQAWWLISAQQMTISFMGRGE